MTRTKYICPECRDRESKKVNLVVKGNSKPHCPVCGFKCRRSGNTMINEADDRRGNHFHYGAWETL